MLLYSIFLAFISGALADVEVEVDGTTYISYGLKGFGAVPADAVDKYGDSISIGSSVAYQDLNVDQDGVYHFTAFGLPDRGYNVDGTVNYVSRIQKYLVDFTPLNSSTTKNIIWNYEDTILLKDMNGNYLSGLDCNTSYTWDDKLVPAVTYHGDGWGNNLNSTYDTTAICLDAEALVLIDGDINNGFWIGDEYGPSLFKFDGEGNMIDYIEAPEAILPHLGSDIYFSSDSPPSWDIGYTTEENDSGRTDNKGYEAIDLSPDGKYLYAALQAATMQDGGAKSKDAMVTRLVKYDVSVSPPELVGEYAIILPTYEVSEDGKVKNKTASQSELRVIGEDVLILLPRDSHFGNGGTDGTESIFKHVDIWSLTDADNIAGEYDDFDDQIAKKGVLNSKIIPATHYSFIDLLNSTELAKFGLHNGGEVDSNLINEKWEGMTLIPVQCTSDEYFLLLTSDNDFQTTQGFEDFGKIPYDAGLNVDSQTMIYHIKLPTLPHNEVCPAISSSAASSKSSNAISSSVKVSPSLSSSLSLITSLASSFSNISPFSAITTSTSETTELSSGLLSSDIISTSTPASEEFYSTITTVTNGVTEILTVPCSTSFSSFSFSSPSTSYTTITTVTDGVTETLTVPCDTDSITNSLATTVNAESSTIATVTSGTSDSITLAPEQTTLTKPTGKLTSSINVQSTEAAAPTNLSIFTDGAVSMGTHGSFLSLVCVILGAVLF